MDWEDVVGALGFRFDRDGATVVALLLIGVVRRLDAR
jgi:hypothetical protein